MTGLHLAVLSGATAYAVLRYVGFGGVSLSQVPAYVFNKGLAMAAAVSLFLAALAALRDLSERRRFWMRGCERCALLHAAISLGLFSRAYFGKLFDGERLSLAGETTLLLGAMAAASLWRYGVEPGEVTVRGRQQLALCAFAAGHVLAMGYGGWLQVERWHGGLPPITLVCFALFSAALVSFAAWKPLPATP